MRRRILSFALVLLAAISAAFAQTDPVSVASPDGQLEFRLIIVTPEGSRLVRLAYQVSFHGKLLIDTSLLGIALRDQDPILGENVGLVSAKEQSVDEGRIRYHSVIAQYIQNGSLGRRITIEARAYDDGVAFRYYIPRTSMVEDLQIEEELTDFHFAQNGPAYASTASGYDGTTGEYTRIPLDALKRTSLIALPFLVEQPGVGWAAITQAQLDNYPGMYLFHAQGSTVRSTLAPRVDDATIVMHGVTPAESPWRVLMVADNPGTLLTSNIVQNLNPPSAIADGSWIKPVTDWAPASAAGDVEAQFANLEKSGAAGVKMDLLHRVDQQMIGVYRDAAKTAAEHHLRIEFQNAPAPDGIARTWPNVIALEDTPFQRLLATF